MKYDLSEYNDELSSLNLVRENHIPYMIVWVKYYHILGDPDEAVFADILYREGKEDWLIRQALDAVRARRPSRLPVVLTAEEVGQVLKKTKGLAGLVIRLIYSSGLRLSEAICFRAQDINLENTTI